MAENKWQQPVKVLWYITKYKVTQITA